MGILSGIYHMIQVAVVNAFFTEEEQERIKALKKDGKEEEARETIRVIINEALDPWDKHKHRWK